MRIAVGASAFNKNNPAFAEVLKEKNIEIIENPFGRKMTEDEIIEHLRNVDGLLAGLEPLNEKVFKACPKLKAIARIGIGMDNVDKEAATRFNIKVSNTPEGPSDAVAEMTLTVLLNLLHNVKAADADVHNGVWKKRLGHSIKEMTILIVGYGHIGRKTAALLEMLGANVLIYDKYNDGVSTCTLEEGIKIADVISLHASGKEEIISEKMIGEMKPGVILLNSARGGLLNEEGLYKALKSGKVGGFWGDALWTEPYDGIIKECDNAILTPHLCTYTQMCRQSMEAQAFYNLIGDLENV